MAPCCFICQGGEFAPVTAAYRQCRRCGHETLATAAPQTFMLNDPLNADDVKRTTALDRFQDAVLDRFRGDATKGQWVDLGSGSGKLLFRNRGKFARCCGVEITPAAVAFSREVLGLNIVTDIGQVAGEVTFATAWHSLEHFPAPALEALLSRLGTNMPAGARFIISVPNAASWQARLFRTHYAFLDVPNHLQQFTPDSLRRLLDTHGFRCAGPIISWPYNAFGYAQALLNLIMRDHNYLYYRLKRRTPVKAWPRDAANFLLLPVVAPLGALFSLADAISPARQDVSTFCFEKRG